VGKYIAHLQLISNYCCSFFLSFRAYLEEGGSNLIGTNTFSSTTIAMADYKMEDYAYELNYEGACLAREVCDEITAKDPRYVPQSELTKSWGLLAPIMSCLLKLNILSMLHQTANLALLLEPLALPTGLLLYHPLLKTLLLAM